MPALSAELQPHPTTPCDAIRRIEVTIEPAADRGALRIRFRVEGDIGRLRLPLPEVARRRDGLWQHSCFEAFLKAGVSGSYYEFNFAPSLDWAAYRFGGRRRDRTAPGIPAPALTFTRESQHCELAAEIPVAALPGLAGAATIEAGLAAVLEGEDGSLSYWALAHGGESPDFHDPASFVLPVAAP